MSVKRDESLAEARAEEQAWTAGERQAAIETGPFQVYRLMPTQDGGSPLPHRVASCDGDSLGDALLTLHAEGEFDGFAVGIKYQPDPETPGTWLVNPWQAASR